MPVAEFKNSSFMEAWQWTVLIIFCITLLLIAFLANRYGKKGKLNSHQIKEFDVEQQKLSNTASVYLISRGNEQFYIFESQHGVIQLNKSKDTN